MFERILVALDNSADNVSVFETALSLAKWADSRLLLAHVLPCEDMNSTVCETQGLKMLRQFHTLASAAGIGSDLAQPLANPGHQICELAIGWGADLIIVGRRGLTSGEEATQGSVSQYVTHHAACPVLIVQRQSWEHPGHSGTQESSQMAIAR